MIPIEDRVILVDINDRPIGEMGKMEAHRTGRLHRAFSAFVFNSRGELMLQKRALTKYHSRGLWTNTCCSHPRPGESVEAAAHRRLQEEMGIACTLERQFGFVYRSDLALGLVEHEYDHVLTGHSDHAPRPNPTEVLAWRHASVHTIQAELEANPESYTAWFRICFRRAAEAAGHAVETD